MTDELSHQSLEQVSICSPGFLTKTIMVFITSGIPVRIHAPEYRQFSWIRNLTVYL